MGDILEEVDPAARAVLERFGFDAERFERLRAAVAAGRLSRASNVVQGHVEPPLEDDLTQLPARGDALHADAYEAGLEALRAGAVATIVLAGGMATRFGGVVKATAPVLGGRSFLELELEQTRRVAEAVGADVPVALMTSFATDGPVRGALGRLGGPPPLVFSQFAAPRLAADGSLFRTPDGQTSLYGPGHGDLLEAIRVSGVLAELRRRGVRHVTVSNVDNLGARLDPVVLGMHLLSGRPLTAEVTRGDGDVGGAPVRVDGRTMLLERPRFPAGFDQAALPVLNTNTATIDLDLLGRPVELTWLYVEKSVGGSTAVQLEHLYHELASFAPTTFLVVPRAGPRGRFFPIKEPADLERTGPQLEIMLARSPLER